ncbi:MAG: DUF2100 domain-containing protein [Promethearchaeota archaeon]
MDDINRKILERSLKSLSNKLQPLFTKYISTKNISGSGNAKRHIKKVFISTLGENSLALVSSNSTKKKLKNLGIDPRKVVVSGGPFFFEDYIKINPNLTENALQDLNKKCEKLLTQLKNENWKDKDLYFVYDLSNITDKLIFERIDELSREIGKKINIIQVSSLDELSD